MKDYYKILDLQYPSSKKDIKKSYKQLARQYHPDVNQKDTTMKFQNIVEAYDVLSDPNKKATYDAFYFAGCWSFEKEKTCEVCMGSSVEHIRCYLCDGVGFYFKKVKYGKYDVESKIICTLCCGKGIMRSVCYNCKQ